MCRESLGVIFESPPKEMTAFPAFAFWQGGCSVIVAVLRVPYGPIRGTFGCPGEEAGSLHDTSSSFTPPTHILLASFFPSTCWYRFANLSTKTFNETSCLLLAYGIAILF